MTPDTFLRDLRDLIQDDVGQRGLARDPIDNLLTARPDDFAAACHSIADHPAPRVGIVTGFMIPAIDPPTGEMSNSSRSSIMPTHAGSRATSCARCAIGNDFGCGFHSARSSGTRWSTSRVTAIS